MNKTGKPKEEEYAAYLSASALKNLSVATTIGNHDSLNPDYATILTIPTQRDWELPRQEEITTIPMVPASLSY